MAHDDDRGRSPSRTTRAGPTRRGRGRWWARRAGRRRSGRAAGGEADAGRLSARQRRHRQVEVDVEPEVVDHHGRTRSSRSAPPSASHDRARRSRRRRRRCAVGERVRGASSSAWAASTPVRRARLRPHRLARERARAPAQVADVRGRRATADRARVRRAPPARMRSRVVLPAPFGPDEPTRPGRDDEVEAGEQRAVTVPGGHPSRLQRCAHAPSLTGEATHRRRTRVRPCPTTPQPRPPSRSSPCPEPRVVTRRRHRLPPRAYCGLGAAPERLRRPGCRGSDSAGPRSSGCRRARRRSAPGTASRSRSRTSRPWPASRPDRGSRLSDTTPAPRTRRWSPGCARPARSSSGPQHSPSRGGPPSGTAP